MPLLNNRPPLTKMFKIITSPSCIGHPLGIAILWNLEDGAMVESDSAKLISDDSSSEATEIDSKNLSRNQIWNTFNANVLLSDGIIFFI